MFDFRRFNSAEVTKIFRGRPVTGVMVVKEEDRGMFRLNKKQRNSVELETCLLDDVELRENQAEQLYESATKHLLEAPTDAPTDFVLGTCDPGSGAGLMMFSKSSASGSDPSRSLPNKDKTAQSAKAKAKPRPSDPADDGDDDEDDCSGLSSRLLTMFGGSGAAKAKPKAKAGAKPKAKPVQESQRHEEKKSAGAAHLFQQLRAVPASTSAGTGKRANAASAGEEEPSKKAKVRGRQSASAVHQADETFLSEAEESLAELAKSDMQQLASEKDLHTFCQAHLPKCQDLSAQASQKIAQMKRRKNSGENSAMLEKAKDINAAASTLQGLFTQLSSVAPKADELGNLINLASQQGFDCGRVSKMKLLKAEVMDFVKFGKFDELADAITQFQSKASCEDADYFQAQLCLILEQVLQKLLRAMPQTQVRFGSPWVTSIRRFVDAIVAKDQLDLPPEFQVQFNKLQLIFAHDDKTLLPNAVLSAAGEVLQAKPESKLFYAMVLLPQGSSLVEQAQAAAKKRWASEEHLVELEQVTCNVKDMESKASDLSAEEVGNVWDRLANLRVQLAGKQEFPNVEKLELQVKALCEKLITLHTSNDLAPFIQSQVVHATNKMACLKKPEWSVVHLRKIVPDHAVFRRAARAGKDIKA